MSVFDTVFIISFSVKKWDSVKRGGFMSTVCGIGGRASEIILTVGGKDCYSVNMGKVEEWELQYNMMSNSEIVDTRVILTLESCLVTPMFNPDKLLSKCSVNELVDELSDRLSK